LAGRAAVAGCSHVQRADTSAAVQQAVGIGLYPIVTFQYSSTTLYQFSDHIQ
jgi:hypothetical protein